MKRFIKTYSELILAGLSFSGILIYHFLYGMDDKLLLGLLGTIATLYFGSIKLRIENDKLFKQLFQEFNSRYNYKLNDLINEIKYDQNKELSGSERNLIISYLNLCSEEYLWSSRNRIPPKVWHSWKAGIKENLKIKQIKEVFDDEVSTPNGKISFYGLVEDLKK